MKNVLLKFGLQHRRALGIVATIIHTAIYLVEVIGDHPRNQTEIVGQILSHFRSLPGSSNDGFRIREQ